MKKFFSLISLALLLGGLTANLKANNNTVTGYLISNSMLSGAEAPAQPPIPSVDPQCGKTILTTVNPPAGISYHWQGKNSNGMTFNSSLTYEATTTGTYYIRAYNALATPQWSVYSTSVSIGSIRTIPLPPTPMNGSRKGAGEVCIDAVQNTQYSTIEWLQYGASTPFLTGTTHYCTNLTATTVYQAQARQNNCPSSKVDVTATILPPDPPTDPQQNTNLCGYTRLYYSTNPPTGINYYWQGSNSAGGLVNTDPYFDVNSTGTYYVQAYDPLSNKWSSVKPIIVPYIKPIPLPPTPINGSLKGAGEVCIDAVQNTQYSTIEWLQYGASTPFLTGTTHYCPNLITTTAYQAQASLNNCTSGKIDVIATILPPDPPSTPTSVNHCGYTILTRAAAPTVFKYYWQTSSNGQSTSDDSLTHMVTTPGTYYLRAHDEQGSNLWSTAAAITVPSITGVPDGPIVPNVSRYGEGPVELTVTGIPLEGGQTIWLEENTNTVLSEGSNTFTTPALNSTTRYHVLSRTSTCTSLRTLVTATVTIVDLSYSCPQTLNPPPGVTTPTKNSALGIDYILQNTIADGSEGYTNYNLYCNGGDFRFNLTSNVPWSISGVPDWAFIKQGYPSNGGSGVSLIEMYFSPNYNASERQAYFTITAGNITERIYLTQETKNLTAVLYGSDYLSTNPYYSGIEYNLSHESRNIRVDVSASSGMNWTAEVINDDPSNLWLGTSTMPALDEISVPVAANIGGSRKGKVVLKHDNNWIYIVYLEQLPVGGFYVTTPYNYVQTTAYREGGAVAGQSIQYYDKLGKPTQSISRDITKNMVVAAQTVYDDYGRPQFSTLPAAVNRQTMNYIDNFLSESTLKDINEIKSNTLCGRYYSILNTDEPYVPEDEYAFTKVVYSQTIPGAVRDSYMPGAVTSGKSGHAFTVYASADEIYDLAFHNYVDATTLKPNNEATVRANYEGMTKSVSQDVMGKESVTYYNAQGQAFASCMGDPDATTYLVTNTIKTDGEVGYIDIHLPVKSTNYTLTKNGSWIHEVVNLATDASSAPSNAGTISLAPGFYRIVCLEEYTTTDEVTFTSNIGYKYHSFTAYDEAGRVVRTISPKDVEDVTASGSAVGLESRVSKNTYNSLGQVTSSYSPDEGLTEYLYRKDGNIRCARNAQQLADRKFSYTNYDEHGRVVEVGEFDYTNIPEDVFAAVRNNQELLDHTYKAGDGFDDEPANSYQETYSFYGDVTTNSPEPQNFPRGRVSKTSNANVTTWYSYRYDGLVDWVIQEINDFNPDNQGTANNLTTPAIEDPNDLVKIVYSYDWSGRATSVTYRPGKTDEFTHYYEYDYDGRLLEVNTKTLTGAKTLQAKYYYYQHGPLKRVELAGNLQGIDYVYNINGWLKSINNPNGTDPGADGNTGNHSTFGTDIFAMGLDYYSGDYVRTGTGIGSNTTTNNFDGNIAMQHWVNKGLPVAEQGHQAYKYIYDNRNFLGQAVFGDYNGSTYAFTAGTGNKYGECGLNSGNNITYDANGNIQTLQRFQGTGTSMDKFTYNYTTAGLPNRLGYVADNSGYATNYGDLKTQAAGNYTYNNIGQLTIDNNGKDGSGHKFTYDVYGHVTEVRKKTDNSLIAQYTYDDGGFRIKKVAGTETTWYIRDASGNILADYTTTGASTLLEEVPIYASGRIGLAKADAGVINLYEYELTDHLGNVRATFAADGGDTDIQPDIKTAADYYSFGMEMPGRVFGTDYRFGYQGQFAEKDEETGYNQFEARLFDNRIGRWLIPDPAGQYWSPYLGMGNNPVMGVDPDGEWVEGEGFFRNLFRSDKRIYAENMAAEAQASGLCPGYTFEAVKGPDGWGVSYQQNMWQYYTGDQTRYIYRSFTIVKKNGEIGSTLGGFNTNGPGDKEPGLTTPMIGPVDIGMMAYGLGKVTIIGLGRLAAKTSTRLVEKAAVHGNSLLSTKPTWGYKLFSNDGTFLKNGITNKLIPETRYTKAFMSDKYMEAIPFPNRLGAYQWEFGQNQILRGPLNFNMH